MGMLKFEVEHGFSKDEAKKRVEALLRYWGDRYGVRSSWSGDRATLSGKAMGVSIDGSLEIGERSVGGEAADPGMLLRGQAKKYLTRKFSDYLDPKKDPAKLGEEA